MVIVELDYDPITVLIPCTAIDTWFLKFFVGLQVLALWLPGFVADLVSNVNANKHSSRLCIGMPLLNPQLSKVPIHPDPVPQPPLFCFDLWIFFNNPTICHLPVSRPKKQGLLGESHLASCLFTSLSAPPATLFSLQLAYSTTPRTTSHHLLSGMFSFQCFQFSEQVSWRSPWTYRGMRFHQSVAALCRPPPMDFWKWTLMILLSCNRYCMRLAILTICLIADTVSHPMVKPNHKSIPVSCSQLDRHSLKSVCSGLFARFEPPCVEKISVCCDIVSCISESWLFIKFIVWDLYAWILEKNLLLCQPSFSSIRPQKIPIFTLTDNWLMKDGITRSIK